MKKMGLGIILGLLLYSLFNPTAVLADDGMVIEMFEKNKEGVSEEDDIESPDTNLENNDNQDGNPPEEQSESDDETDNSALVFDLIKMAFALLLILALIYLLLKFLNKRNKLFSQVKTLENLGGISVGPSKSIQIVRVGSKLYLIGVGENVQLLEEIKDQIMIDEIMQSFDEQSNFKAGNFLSVFQSKTNQSRSSTVPNKSKSEFKQLFSTELEKLKQNRKSLMNKHAEKEDNHE
jgi:flagellar protein FliO/FliZ